MRKLSSISRTDLCRNLEVQARLAICYSRAVEVAADGIRPWYSQPVNCFPRRFPVPLGAGIPNALNNWSNWALTGRRRALVGDLPAGPGKRASEQPPGNELPEHACQPDSVPGPRLTIALAVNASAATEALAGALTLPVASHLSVTTATTTSTPTETAQPQQRLREAYKMAAQAARVETAGSDKALGRIATTNGAILLGLGTAIAAPDTEHRDAGRAPAIACRTRTAKNSYGIGTDTLYQAALDDALSEDAAMKMVCGGA